MKSHFTLNHCGIKMDSDEPKGFIRGKEPFGYHLKMG